MSQGAWRRALDEGSTFVILCAGFLAACAGGAPPAPPPGAFVLPDVDLGSLPEAMRAKAMAARERAERDPGDPNAVGELGMRYFAHGFPAAAAVCLERAAALDPSSLRWIYDSGLAYEKSGEAANAERAF